MISNGCSLHLPNLHLHDVLEEASSDKIVELSLVAAMLSFVFAHLIVKVVDIVRKIVPHHARSSRFQLEHNLVAVAIDTLRINLRPQEELA
jgi:hypothetical protein